MSTRQFAVLGYPINHSKSPLLHNASYRFLGLDGLYSSIEVQKGELGSFLAHRGNDFDGFSITMPLKEEAFALASKHDELSSSIGVANTLIRERNQWLACNTDILGFEQILTRHFSSNLQDPVVLGSGSTAKSAIVALSKLGVSSLRIMARNASAVQHIEKLFRSLQITYLPWGGDIRDVSMVISAVPEVSGISFDKSVTQFLDVTYGEKRENLIRAITATHYNYKDGFNLLVYQAAHQVLQMRSVDERYYEEIVNVMFEALAKEI